jgi:carboxylesterase
MAEPRRDESPERPTDPSPIALGDGDAGVVVLHGLTGTPYEIRPVAEALAGAGFAVRGPLLPGHEDLAALEHATWRGWYDAAEAEFEALRDGGRRPVVVVGFSMGSLLALRIGALRPRELAGVVAAAVPLSLPVWQQRAIGAMSRLRTNRWVGGLVGTLAKHGPDVRVADEVRRSPSLQGLPYPALEQLVGLQHEVDGLLELVRAPLLLLHGRYDHVAPSELSARVAQRVASAEVTRVVLGNSFHILALDLDRERVCAEVVAFARRHLPSPPQVPRPEPS